MMAGEYKVSSNDTLRTNFFVGENLGVKGDLITSFQISSIFPNPITRSGYISYTLPQQGYCKIDVTNAAGMVVRSIAIDGLLERGLHSQKIDFSDLQKGAYWIRFSFSTETKNEIRKSIPVLLQHDN